MSNESELTLPAASAAATDTGPSWLSILAGVSFVATVAVLAGILMVRFVQTRPVNVAAPSAQLAGLIETALRDNFIPESAIAASTTQEQTDEGNRWTHNRYDVTLPPRLDAQGIATVLGEELRNYNLTVTQEEAAAGAREVKVWLANFEVALISLTPTTAPAAALTDLRVASTRLVEEARVGLEVLGLNDSVFQSTPETREDTEAKWYLTRLEVRPAQPLSAADLTGAIRGALSYPDVEVRAADPAKGTMNVTMAYRGKPVADMTVYIPDASARPPAVAVPLSLQPDLNDLLNTAIPSARVAVPLAPPVEEGYEVVPPATADEVAPVSDSSAIADGRMQLASLPQPPGPRSVADATNPRVAIILDDGGYGGAVTERVLALDSNLTLAILPNTPYGKDTAERGAALGFEIMLHMPMQTGSSTVKSFPGQINVDMGREEIAALTTDAIAQIPGAVGVNNHTGSLFTSDAERMELFLESIVTQGWYFIDSKTGPNSRAYDVAQAMGIRSESRDIFLDDVADAAEIKRQWAEMVRIARKTGTAIAIGHFRPLTIDVLEQELPKLASAGIALVPASELVR